MSNFIVKETGGKRFPIIEAGAYPAICYAIIDVGEQYSPQFNNTSRKVIFMWELPMEEIEIDGVMKPRAISETYTLSLGEKAKLRAMLENWRGRSFTQEELKGFDLENVLGKPCMLSIIHKTKQDGSQFASIASVSRLPKGMQVPEEPFNAPFLLSLDDPDALERMNLLPEWIQNRICESETYKDMTRPKDKDGFVDMSDEITSDSDLPF